MCATLKKEFYRSVPEVVYPKADMPSKSNMMMAAEVLVLILMESLTLGISGGAQRRPLQAVVSQPGFTQTQST